MGFGSITAHALMSLEARGTLFVTPGMEVGTMAILCALSGFFSIITCLSPSF